MIALTRRTLLTASATFGLFLLAALIAVWAIYYAPGPSAEQGDKTVVTLSSGSGVSAIAARMKAAGVIRSTDLFRAAATLTATGLPAAARTVELTLLSPLGQVVRCLPLPAAQGAATGTVPTAGLATGLYLLQLRALTGQGAVLGALPAQRLRVE